MVVSKEIILFAGVHIAKTIGVIVMGTNNWVGDVNDSMAKVDL